MFIIRGYRRLIGLKFQRNSRFYIKLIITLVILTFVYDRIFSRTTTTTTTTTMKKTFQRRGEIVVQTDLLDYNEDDLRSDWPFEITKNYDIHDLRTYTSKPIIFSTNDLPGERGMPVTQPRKVILLPDLYSEYQLNIVASDKVAHNRSLPDLRDSRCLNIRYPKLLPSATVIITVHNEAWSVLLRAIWSVINRSPDELLEELILIDDFSDKPHLNEQLEEYLPIVSSKIKLVRTEKREGLIRARLIGAEQAQGQVLIFLDSNTECTDGWMEPLLSRIASDRSVVVTPRIDNITSTTIAYEELNDNATYGFGWNLYYHLFPIPEREVIRNNGDLTAPYRTPSLIGCATAIDREFFFEIGSFDKGMVIWGGEATELSIRVWQCGGAVEIVPCSRVGHYFRFTPFSFNGDKLDIERHNNIRTAQVWMDESKIYHDTLLSPTQKKIKSGDVTERIALREQLKCKGFHWYLENIFPESAMSIGPVKIGQMQRIGSTYCMDRLGRAINRQIGINKCHGNGYSQGFSYQKNNQIVFHPSLCLGIAHKENVTEPPRNAKNSNDINLLTPDMDTKNHVVLLPCNSTNGDKWAYNETNNQMIHMERGTCLTTDGWMIAVLTCNPNDDRQRWRISSYEEYKNNILPNPNH